MVNVDFPLILVSLVFMSGIIALFDILFLAKRRREKKKSMPMVVDYARSFFPVFLIVLIIRSFLIQPFNVPSGSLEPTVQPGDFLLVNQFAYGLRLPVLNKKIVNIGEPKRGDIIVFRFPADPRVNFVKRVIGVPGDHVVYRNKLLTINGVPATQKELGKIIDFEPPHEYTSVNLYEEDLSGVKHQIQLDPHFLGSQTYDVIVPKGYYFAMGDNRDKSEDSRYWGFVPEANLVGKAFFIWMSWDKGRHWFAWSRIGTRL